MSDAIDRKHLDQIGARFGAPFVVQLIDLFIAQGRERIAAAEEAAAAGDAKAVAAMAHALKSSAGNLGALALGARAAEIERAASAGGTAASLAPMVGALSADFSGACAALAAVRARVAEPGTDRR